MPPIEEPKLSHLIYKRDTDYTRALEIFGLGVCEVGGNDPDRSQEDTVCVEFSEIYEAFIALSKEEREQVAKNTFASLQAQLSEAKNAAAKVGSCACVTTCHLKEGVVTASTSYVGDSVAFFIVLKNDGSLKSVHACNNSLHNCYNPGEYRDVILGIGRTAGTIKFKSPTSEILRLNGQLTVTRAFGDNEQKGISHLPETTETKFHVEPTDKVYMVLTCDGAMEHLKDFREFAEELGDLFVNYHTLPPEQLAEKIVNNALTIRMIDNVLYKGSKDNITAIVIKLSEDYAVQAGVFDGHAGKFVSDFLRDHYLPTFKQELNRFFENKKTTTTQPKSEEEPTPSSQHVKPK